ncbi:hypothetical protein CKO35_10615 [Ectothiorhodospira shaposhnikovii]|uniref:MobH family relaxase n=1 Tax=Ectothiorhodospira shaposhnikovii TaxID=1054 RepID=UPI0019042DA6|nr:MobH family relaxase [Ectothiorhodospira shaposhnikovii]MBK1673752.1 hypothetical protein [Ectothiorhodospira shaposhnikovii]
MNTLRSWFSRSLGRPQPGGSTSNTPEVTGSQLIPVQDSTALLQPSHRQALLTQISALTALPARHYQALVMAAIHRYAAHVQCLPASEAHHHAGLGGMLDHGLDVLLQALLIRRGRLLPVGATAERIAQCQDAWTYAVATAALLHDIGKPAVDQQVSLYDGQGRSLGHWEPWIGPMTAVDGCRHYSIEFRRGRRHRFHERAAPLLAHQIIPARGIAWLASDQVLFAAWLATLSGDMDDAGALGEIIQQADGLSVARNLGAGDTARPVASRTKPLWERLLIGLRYLLDQGELPLNRNGAAGWLVGDDLWLVSKRAVDALRAHLGAEGHAGIPSSNDRIYDTLQEHGVLEPCGDRAIWRATVAGDGWSHGLTLIRIPAQRVWPSVDTRPTPFEGSVTPDADDGSGSDNSHGDAPFRDITHHEAPAETLLDKVASHRHMDSTGNQVPREKIPLLDDPLFEDLPMPPCQTEPETALPVPATASPSPSAATPQTMLEPTDSVSEPLALPSDGTPSDEGRRFLTWLKAEVAQRRLEVNNTAARLHVVEEGLLLVSPGIFRDYAAQVNVEGGWEHVQKRFMKLKLHARQDDGTNIHRYMVTGERRSSTIKGILLPDIRRVFGEQASLPQPNPHLKPTGRQTP